MCLAMTRLISIAKWFGTIALKAAIFAVPVTIVGHLCGVEPTWQTVAFVMFCIIWNERVDRISFDKADEPAPVSDQKAVRVVLTPAEVAAEAQKLTPRPLRFQ
jgi:hypothetical protein